MQQSDPQQISEKEFYWLGVNDQVEFLESLKEMLPRLGLLRAQVTQLRIDALATLDDLQKLKRLVRDRMKQIKGTSLPNMYELRWHVKPLMAHSEVIRVGQNLEIKKAEEIYLQYRRKEIE